MNKITKEDVANVQAFWYSYGPLGGKTEVVEILDDMTGKRSILIKEVKNEKSARQNPKL